MKTGNLLNSPTLLTFLDGFLHLVHLSIIFFFLVGWLYSGTRAAHVVLSLLILASWYGLGSRFGYGYCLVTDLQWRIKRRRNQPPPTEYYVKYILDRLTGKDSNPVMVNKVTICTFFLVLCLSVILLLTLGNQP